jgi:hypothetical protein
VPQVSAIVAATAIALVSAGLIEEKPKLGPVPAWSRPRSRKV